MEEAYQDKKPGGLVSLNIPGSRLGEGHKSSRTTEIYTHVSMKSLKNITNPLNDFEIYKHKPEHIQQKVFSGFEKFEQINKL